MIQKILCVFFLISTKERILLQTLFKIIEHSLLLNQPCHCFSLFNGKVRLGNNLIIELPVTSLSMAVSDILTAILRDVRKLCIVADNTELSYNEKPVILKLEHQFRCYEATDKQTDTLRPLRPQTYNSLVEGHK